MSLLYRQVKKYKGPKKIYLNDRQLFLYIIQNNSMCIQIFVLTFKIYALEYREKGGNDGKKGVT